MQTSRVLDKTPKPIRREIQMEFVRGLLIDGGRSIQRYWPTLDQLAVRHRIRLEELQCAAKEPGTDGLNWYERREAFQRALELADEEARAPLPNTRKQKPGGMAPSRSG